MMKNNDIDFCRFKGTVKVQKYQKTFGKKD